MSLKIVYGKSGSGKSTYIFNEIAEKISNEKTNKKIYIITPEQFSFTAEKKLLNSIRTNAVLNAEVLTFNRMAYRVLNEVKRANNQNLSKVGKSMLVYNILSEEKGNLKFLGKSSENVDLVSKQITEFKKHNITVENLQEVSKSTEDKYLKSKLSDMINVYEKYNQVISENYIDENDMLTILAEYLPQVKDFKNCDIYIDEFVGFTKQEYEILRNLLENKNDIVITVCTDSLDLSITPDTDIFYSNKQTVDKIFEIAKQTNTKIEMPVELEKEYRFKTPELRHLEKNIYNIPYQKYPQKVENMKLFLANNPYSEVEYIASQIVKLVRNEGYRYNEIAVITKNLDNYSNLCKAIFSKYQIPVFIDEKKDLSQNILVKYILAIINIFARNWTYESMFEYIKTGFLGLDKNDINVLENYCLKWGIKGSKWYKDEWTFYDEAEDVKNKVLHMRQVVIEPLLELKKQLSGTKTIRNITENLYEYLIKTNIPEKLSEKIQYLNENGEIEKANEYQTSWNIIIDVLDEIILVLGDKNVTFDKYADILKIGLGNSGLGKIPGTQDQVIIGDVDRSRSHKVRTVFIIGLNDGVFPSVNKNEGFFNDNDRENLKSQGAELAKGTLEKLYDDNFNIYKAFSTAEEKIYLSYSSTDLESKTLRPSILINRIKKIFPNLQEESDVIERISEIITKETTFEELLNKLRDFRDGEEIEPIWFEVYNYYQESPEWRSKLENSLKALSYTNIPENINKESIEKLYGNTLKTSVSRLEQYKSCPFSYYLKYGLKLSDKNEFKIEAIDTGTFMHDVIDSFFDKLAERKLDIKEITKTQIDELIDEIIEEKLSLKKNYIFTSIPKYRVLVNRLRKVVKKSMTYIVESLKYSKFEVMGHELEFGQGKEYEPIEMQLDNGKKVAITGKIDRIDIAKTADGRYIRIIDYKSSTKDINLNEVVAGLQLQLLTYLDAVCEKEDLQPAGVLYFNLINPVIKASSHMSDEEMETEIRKRFKMKGLVLADIDIVKMMDTKLERGSSEIIPAYVDKDGNLSNRANNINREQFENLQKYTNKIIKQISNEILSGNIDIKPYYKIKGGKTPCEYCSYRSICNFNNGICKNSYNYINNFNKDYVLEQIKERNQEG